MTENKVELLAYWITEREAIRKAKEAGAAMGAGPGLRFGWSDDPAMGTVRYCNVRREDDKVTKWLAEHWRPTYSAAWELTLARMVNYIPTLEECLIHLNGNSGLAEMGHSMKSQRAKGHKIWTSAYTISTCGQSMDKIDYVMGVVGKVKLLEEEHNWLAQIDSPTLDHTHKWLTQVDGLGSFLAGQVVADMKNTEGHPLQQANDWYGWSTHGPGSMKGLAEFFGRPVTPRTYQADIRKCWAMASTHLPDDLQNLHMQDFQNCMCEFSKFMRVRAGGHARNRYAATSR